MTNKELNIYIEKYKNGDQEAFNVIYQETYQSVYYTIYLLTKNTTIIEDFVQDTYLKVIDKIDSYKIGTNFKAWICTIAHNLSVNGLIQKSKEIPVELSSQTEYIFGPAPKNDTRIYKALEILEGEEKEIVTLKLIGDLKFREIASMLDKPMGTVQWIYNTAIKKLRKKVGEENE